MKLLLFCHNSAVGLFFLKFSLFPELEFYLLSQEFKRNFQKMFELSQFLNCLKQYETFSTQTIVYEDLQHGIKQKCVTFVVHNLKF